MLVNRYLLLAAYVSVGLSWIPTAHPQGMRWGQMPMPSHKLNAAAGIQTPLLVRANVISICTITTGFFPLPSIICTQGVSWHAAVDSSPETFFRFPPVLAFSARPRTSELTAIKTQRLLVEF